MSLEPSRLTALFTPAKSPTPEPAPPTPEPHPETIPEPHPEAAPKQTKRAKKAKPRKIATKSDESAAAWNKQHPRIAVNSDIHAPLVSATHGLRGVGLTALVETILTAFLTQPDTFQTQLIAEFGENRTRQIIENLKKKC